MLIPAGQGIQYEQALQLTFILSLKSCLIAAITAVSAAVKEPASASRATRRFSVT